MRIVAAHPGPSFSVHDVHVGWVEALRKLGHAVAEYNLSERINFYELAQFEDANGEYHKALTTEQAMELATTGLYATLYKLRPDLLLITSAFYYPPDLFHLAHSHGTKIVVIHTESPYEDDRQLRIAPLANVNLINDPVNLEKFKDVNPCSYYTPHSYRPGFHSPGSSVPEMSCDFAFVGTAYRSRIEFLERMAWGDMDVFLAGNWTLLDDDSPLAKYVAHERDECIDNEQAVQIYRSMKVGLNLYRKEADSEEHMTGWACGPREIEMAACGAFFLREPRGESDDLFQMLPIVRSPQEATDELLYWLDHQDLREKAAQQAMLAIQDRTFINRAKELMLLLGQ